MKSRSHRLPASVDPKDDWVEESWTVDCVCGVNFDDGDEMVNCDECGVWVHTRCSRYVKTDKSFACHRCKNNNSNNNLHHHFLRSNDSEETEVAQLLVELPTKTLMDNSHSLPPPPPPPPHPSSSSYKTSTFTPSRRPFRLWADIPIEDRVHVQGLPGGDPALFSGLSSLFGPQLWKCTGYIPKKFSFRYQEFPRWDDTEEEELLVKETDQQIGMQPNNYTVDDGAGVLFSLARENASPPAGAGVQAEDSKESEGFGSPKETNKLEYSKDRSLLMPSNIHFGKRKMEDIGMSKDKSGKKKARVLEKDGDFNKKNSLRTPGTASTKSSDAKQLQCYEDRGLMAVQIDPQCGKGGNLSYPIQLSRDPGVLDHAIDAQKSNSTMKFEECDKNNHGTQAFVGSNYSEGVPVKEEVFSVAVAPPNGFGGEPSTSGGTDLQKSEQVPEDVATAGPETVDDLSDPDSSINTAANCVEMHAKSKTELANGNRNLNVQLSSLCDSKLGSSGTSVQSQEMSANCSSENVIVYGTNVTVMEATAKKVEDVARRSEVVDIQKRRADGESLRDLCQPNHGSTCLDGFLEAKKISSGFGSNAAFDSYKSGVTDQSTRVDAGEGKVTLSIASSFSASSAILMSKSSENCSGVNSLNDNVDSKLKFVPESNLAGNQNTAHSSAEVVKSESRHDKGKKLMKELPKSSLSSVTKSSQLKKLSHAAAVSKRTSSDSKDSVLDSSLSPTAVPPIASPPTSELVNVQQIESASNVQKTGSMLQTESASSIQKKATGSVLSQKGEKINQSVSQSSSKVNNTSTNAAASSNSPAGLSDEELALLLHQELNSSPRVPRVPRMRHAGSLPQLTSPTATSMLMKRTSSTGGKDHGLTSRRKTKDLPKDGSHGSGEMGDEAKKMERVPSSIDQRRQDSAFASDSVCKREADSGPTNGVYTMKKINAPSRTAASSSLPSPAEGNESNFSSSRHSPRIPSDDEKGAVGHLTHRTLPGLLADIMSAGKRMTYEELCNSVLPHWPYLRKHNGERYAYSSHSQAVLDCLRNRNEWARLVDRGPKTSGGRKRRKSDTGAAGVESEDNDDSRDRAVKDGSRSKTVESHHEEFPKGKRKARKRGRLALQGRGIKDVRRRRKTDEVSADEDGSFSDSSEETMFSEDEIQGSGNDVSASSDGTDNI